MLTRWFPCNFRGPSMLDGPRPSALASALISAAAFSHRADKAMVSRTRLFLYRDMGMLALYSAPNDVLYRHHFRIICFREKSH